MLRVFIQASTKQTFKISIGRNSKNGISIRNIRGERTCMASSQNVNITTARFCSSNSSGSFLHKIFFIDAASPTASDDDSLSNTVEYIPPPPVPPEIVENSTAVLNSLGEPTLHSLGLAGWSPVGLVQSALEHLHVDLGLPWWGSIVVATVIMRMCMFPLVIVSQRNAAKMNQHMPKIQRLQAKMTTARQDGNNYEAAKLGYEMQQYMEKADIKPLRSALVPLVQAPIFISMFIGLRRCANLPVESMMAGGMLWFVDLTVPDPFYALPLITSLTTLATIEIGADMAKMPEGNTMVKYFLRGLPILIFPFVINFPTAVLCYWVSTNFCSLMQVSFLRIPKVRTYFNIAPNVKHPKEKAPGSDKGFIQSVKESWSNMKVKSQIADREKMDEMRFKKSGTGPIIKTFKENPLTQKTVIDVKARIKRD